MRKAFKSLLRITLATLLIVVIVGIGGIVYFVKSLPDVCSSQSLDVIPSPNGKLKAQVYNYDCGVTSSFTSNVEVLMVSAPLPKTNENAVFVCDDGHGVVLKKDQYKRGGPRLKIEWITDSEIRILSPTGTEGYSPKFLQNGVSVKYGGY